MCAADTEAALELLAGHPDALIADVNNTLGLVDAVRGETGPWVDPQRPILVLTSDAGELHRTRLLERGADDVLTKPHSYPELRARLGALLRRARARRAPLVLRAWLDQRQARMPSLATSSPWLFPGNTPSRPIGEQSLSRSLKRIGVDCNQDRRAALLHLAGEIPAAILADIVGVHVTTAGAWANIAGRPCGDYPALRDPTS